MTKNYTEIPITLHSLTIWHFLNDSLSEDPNSYCSIPIYTAQVFQTFTQPSVSLSKCILACNFEL